MANSDFLFLVHITTVLFDKLHCVFPRLRFLMFILRLPLIFVTLRILTLVVIFTFVPIFCNAILSASLACGQQP